MTTNQGREVDLESATEKMAGTSLVLLGIGLMFEVIEVYLLGIYALYNSIQSSAGKTLTLVGGTFLAFVLIEYAFFLILSILLISIGFETLRGVVPQFKTFLAIMMFSLFLLTNGTLGITLGDSVGSESVTLGTISLAAGFLLITGSAFYISRPEALKIFGSAEAILSVILLFFVLRPSPILLREPFARILFLAQYSGPSSPLFPSNVPVASFLLVDPVLTVSYIVVGLAASVHIFLKNQSVQKISYSLAISGFLIFGIGIIASSFSLIFSTPWNDPNLLPNLGLLLLGIVGTVFFSISGLVILASCGLGIGLLASGTVS